MAIRSTFDDGRTTGSTTRSSKSGTEFIEQEIQRRWRNMMTKLDAQLSSAEPSEGTAAA